MKLMAWPEFEEFVGSLFLRLGFAVTPTPARGDHGVDLYAEKPGERAVVQCKLYREWQVSESKVRDLYGVLHHERVDRAYLVTTGQFSRPARKWAQGKPIVLWDGSDLERLARETGGAADPPAPAGTPPVAAGPVSAADAATSTPAVASGSTCAHCGRWVSEGVRRYCAENAARFGGRVYCMEHQKGT